MYYCMLIVYIYQENAYISNFVITYMINIMCIIRNKNVKGNIFILLKTRKKLIHPETAVWNWQEMDKGMVMIY